MAELRLEQAPETSAHNVENRPARNRQQPRKSHDNNHYGAVPVVLGLFGELRLRTRQRGLHQPRRRLRRRQSAEYARNRPPSPQFVRATRCKTAHAPQPAFLPRSSARRLRPVPAVLESYRARSLPCRSSISALQAHNAIVPANAAAATSPLIPEPL